MSSDQNYEWCLIESDPGVFTELLRGFGAKGVQVEEMYELNQRTLDKLKPMHGLIFLFKVIPGSDYSDGTLLQDEKILSEIFFAKQIVKNACGTQALISILMNCNHEDLQIGQALTEYKEANKCADAHTRGIALANNETIRTVHNSFAPQDLALREGYNRNQSSYHFTSYFPFAGRVIEMDGRKEGPYDLGPIGAGEDWRLLACSAISKRMRKYHGRDIDFNVLALISDQLAIHTARLEMAVQHKDETPWLISSLHELIDDEKDKMEQYKKDNIRRRHQYLPLIMDILTALAEQGKLVERFEVAKLKSVRHSYMIRSSHDGSSSDGSSSMGSSSSSSSSSSQRSSSTAEINTERESSEEDMD
ncbi:PREDICTED: ubiquitin carboxyl-terminal hydrolase isozyme L5-like [Rhagoletis zephyria]|uniref:ubiquitin carboxyl-terminal hydrolase isozyme L5-like n=1 Tax=Rhagoletis zephyria TaxID=28612 RepID=UPI0008116F40|nr:PREDICTED: ubiquitin carboxyl-terminal hydrolase isozyme L5-like [Rhagoletis zephyria]